MDKVNENSSMNKHKLSNQIFKMPNLLKLLNRQIQTLYNPKVFGQILIIRNKIQHQQILPIRYHNHKFNNRRNLFRNRQFNHYRRLKNK